MINTVVEGVFRLSATSDDRKELRSVSNIIDFILTHITTARTADSNSINSYSDINTNTYEQYNNRDVNGE